MEKYYRKRPRKPIKYLGGKGYHMYICFPPKEDIIRSVTTYRMYYSGNCG